MATAIHPAGQVNQQPTMTDSETKLPPLGEIDIDQVDFVYDANLDELTIRWVDRSRRTYHVDTSSRMAALVDPISNTTVGFVVGQFTSAIAEHPSLAALLSHSTRLDGTRIIHPAHETAPKQSIWRQLFASARASIQAWTPERNRENEVLGLIHSIERSCLV